MAPKPDTQPIPRLFEEVGTHPSCAAVKKPHPPAQEDHRATEAMVEFVRNSVGNILGSPSHLQTQPLQTIRLVHGATDDRRSHKVMAD